jgi:putative nucleotidyltransferase with HDIG domain
MVPIGWLLHRPTGVEIPTLLYLAVGTQIAALRPIPWRTGHQTVADPLLVAAGLVSPGLGVGLVAWLALFDGRVPGRGIPWWGFFFNRSMSAIAHVIPSVLVASIGGDHDWWAVPTRTIVYVVVAVSANYFTTAVAFSFIRQTSIWTTVAQNVGLSTLFATLVLSFSGGIIFLLLRAEPFPVGYIIAPGLFGFVLAVRGNVADAQRQTVLKDQTLDLAAQALDARDRYTESHSIRVSELAAQLGEQLELGDREVVLIRTAGSLHDLGKLGVRDDILNKPGPLSEEEWEIMRRHPDIGADMIAQHSALAEVAPLVRHHHERWDGTGYPAGLKGEVIPFGARILSVADSFDTITGARLYRRSLMTPIEGVEDISRRANVWYDPNVVDALRELHGLKPLEVTNRPEVPRRITTLRVLRASPGFSSLITAIGISAVGDPLTLVATLVSIYVRTHDPRFVALALIAQAVATVFTTGILGGLADKLTRKELLIGFEVLRAVILLGVAYILPIAWWVIFPAVFVLSSINAIVQPTRQAAISSLVAPGHVGKATAMVMATTMVANAVGFALAGAILSMHPNSPTLLFIADAATFVLAALLMLGIRTLGGGSATVSLSGALKRSWAISSARPQLVIGGLSALLISMSYPALLSLAYSKGGSAFGGQIYSDLEFVLSVGLFAGSLVVSRFGSIGTIRTVGAGLLITGVCSVLIAFSPSLVLIAAALFLASVGNPIYAVANQTALMQATDPAHSGSVMATRFGIVQTASIVGVTLGGFLTQLSNAGAAYGVLGIGLVILAMYAIAAGRTTTNPLHGAAYEEATALQKATAYDASPNGADHEKPAALQHPNEPVGGAAENETKADSEPVDDAAFREAAGRQ